MTTRNFRVNNGLEVGDITAVASSNAITGVSSITLDNETAPDANAKLANKKYVDDQISGVTVTNIAQNNTNVTVSDSGAGTITATVDGNTEMTINDNGVRIHGKLTVDGEQTILNTTTLSVEDNIIELNRNVSTNAATPTVTGIQVNRGEGSTATDQALLSGSRRLSRYKSQCDTRPSNFGAIRGRWRAICRRCSHGRRCSCNARWRS